jgi:uncharacterized protein YqgC (DUF456 family)
MAELNEAVLLFIVILLMIVGLIGTILPILPGILFIWLGVALYAWETEFMVISVPLFILISLLTLFAGASDFWLPYLGAKRSGAAKRAYLLSTIGAIVGSFLLPVVGTIIGFVLGLFLGEYWKRRDTGTAVRVSWAGLKGWGLATLIQLVFAVLVIGLFFWRVMAG